MCEALPYERSLSCNSNSSGVQYCQVVPQLPEPYNNIYIINAVFVYAVFLAIKPFRGALHFT